MNKEEFSKLIKSIPTEPGCYKYYDKDQTLLYVGKAKDIRKRVSSYFNKTVSNYKTQKLVSLIHHIEFTVTDTEHDAFLLENSLIKHYQPRFNIDLKDDKTYPYIVIKKEDYPRVFLTRRLIKDGSEYLGPFTGVARVKELLELVKQNLPIRSCNLPLTHKRIQQGKFKVCLEYHLGNCKGPCEGLQTKEDYMKDVQQVRHIMKGNIQDVVRHLKDEMQDQAAQLAFEKAQIIKFKIDSLLQYQSKSTVVNPKMDNADVITMVADEQHYYVNYMMVNKGTIIQSKTLCVEQKTEEESEEDVLSLILDKMRETFASNAYEVLTEVEITVADNQIKVVVPKVGDKRHLVELSKKNALAFQQELKKKAILNIQQATADEHIAVLKQMRDDLQLPMVPMHIECFDNSNFQGSYPVAAMVCFKKGVPSKQDYRHFHIKTVSGINDFASMSEIVYRRYKRLLDEAAPLPDLVIIDGGKGQLGAALESLEKLGLMGKLTIVGLAKREESIFFPGDSEPIQLPYDSPPHLLIRRIRDEVHRFGITFHRKVRSEGTIKNDLETIPGIGSQTATTLLKAFRSVKHIKTLTERELTAVIGASKARIVYNHFKEVQEDL